RNTPDTNPVTNALPTLPLHDALPIYPDCNDESENDCRQSPPCKLHEVSADVGLAHHESSYFDEKRNVATEGGTRKISGEPRTRQDRKSTRLNSSHRTISYAVFCLKKK